MNGPRAARLFLVILAALCILLGLLWIGQGTGLILWPATSPMLAETRWAAYGAALALAGVLLLRMARRRR